MYMTCTTSDLDDLLSHPSSEKMKPKPLYVCPGCSNHAYSNNMVNRYNISINYRIRSYKMTCGFQKKDYRVAQNYKRRCGFHRHNRSRGRPSFLLLHPTGTIDFDSNI
jgi:hypothetical protein